MRWSTIAGGDMEECEMGVGDRLERMVDRRRARRATVTLVRISSIATLAFATLAFGAAHPGRAKGPNRAIAVKTAVDCLASSGAVSPGGPYVWRTGKVVHVLDWIDTWGASNCELNSPVRAFIERARDPAWDGPVVRAVKRTPSAGRVNATLTPGAIVARQWAWSNWCGSRKTHFQVQVNWGIEVEAYAPVPGTPACVQPAAPSTLKATKAVVRPCRESQFRARIATGAIKSRVIVNVGFEVIGDRICSVSGSFSTYVTALVNGHWTVLKTIAGNPSSQRAGLLLAPDDAGNVLWQWINWCGDTNLKFRFATRFRNHTYLSPIEQSTSTSQFPPFCESTSDPSVLSPSYGFA